MSDGLDKQLLGTREINIKGLADLPPKVESEAARDQAMLRACFQHSLEDLTGKSTSSHPAPFAVIATYADALKQAFGVDFFSGLLPKVWVPGGQTLKILKELATAPPSWLAELYAFAKSAARLCALYPDVTISDWYSPDRPWPALDDVVARYGWEWVIEVSSALRRLGTSPPSNWNLTASELTGHADNLIAKGEAGNIDDKSRALAYLAGLVLASGGTVRPSFAVERAGRFSDEVLSAKRRRARANERQPGEQLLRCIELAETKAQLRILGLVPGTSGFDASTQAMPRLRTF